MDTLKLDNNWDLMVEGDSIALATVHYAIAQDVASACRTFRGELWYDVSFGMPYLSQDLSDVGNILGRLPSIEFVRSQLIAVGKTVPGVANIVCFLTGPNTRERLLGGQLQITNDDGVMAALAQTIALFGGAPWYVSGIQGGETGVVPLTTDPGNITLTADTGNILYTETAPNG